MFTIVTKLTDYPDDPDQAKLARYAILELADRLFLEQPFAELLVRPFQSETLFSYTYSRSTATAAKVTSGMKTGLFWWDLAVDELSVAGSSLLAHGSIAVIPDGMRQAWDGSGWMVVDPAEEEGPGFPPYVRIS